MGTSKNCAVGGFSHLTINLASEPESYLPLLTTWTTSQPVRRQSRWNKPLQLFKLKFKLLTLLMLSNIRLKSCVMTQTDPGVLLQTPLRPLQVFSCRPPPRPVLTSWPYRRKRSVFPGRSPPRLGCSSPPASAELCARAGSSGRACSRWRWPYSTVWQTHKHTYSQLTLTTSHSHLRAAAGREEEWGDPSYLPGIVSLLHVSPPAHTNTHIKPHNHCDIIDVSFLHLMIATVFMMLCVQTVLGSVHLSDRSTCKSSLDVQTQHASS